MVSCNDILIRHDAPTVADKGCIARKPWSHLSFTGPVLLTIPNTLSICSCTAQNRGQ